MAVVAGTAVPEVRDVQVGRGLLTWVARMFYAVGWLLLWVTPPVLVIVARRLGVALRWCATAARLGWTEARDGRPVEAVRR